MAKKTKTKNILKSLKSFSSEVRENKSLHAAFGLAMIFGALFILISGISSLLSWEEDFSYLNYDFADILFNPEINLKNSFGKLGAAIGFFITVRSLGWTFLIPISIIIFWGVQILFNFQHRVSRVLRIGLLYTLFLSSLTGLISEFPVFNSLNDAIVGDSARFIVLWGANLFGKTGTWLIWLAIVLIHVIWFYKLSPQSWKLKPNISETNDDDLLKESNIEPGLVDVQEDSENSLIEFTDNIDSSSPESSTDQEILDNEQTLGSIDNIEDIGLEVADPIDIQSEALEENEDSKMNLGKLKTSYDPKLELSKYVYPTYDLLADVEAPDKVVDADELEANKNRILETLRNYKIEIAKIKAAVGPTVTLYEIIPEAGVRISKIKNLEDDIALSLSALGIRIIAPIPGRGTIGIEVPNRSPKMVSMKSVLTSEKFVKTNMDLPIALGMTISNEVFIADLAKMPHLLMAGATGQGKSVGLNAILASILYKRHPSEVKFVLVDPKKVELTLYNKIERHFLAKLPDTDEAIITDTTKVINTLNSLCIEMDKRYELLKDAMVRNIKEYNQKFSSRKLNPENDHRYLPYIVLVIDEFADLIMTAGKEVETPIARLAQLARAIGIHLIIATQRPSVNVITGIIKANFPARIAFKVSSKIDSRTILDSGGADQLIGKGDMLFSAGNDLIRLQCAFLDTPEVEEVCDFIGSQQAYPDAYALPEYTGEENGSSGSNYSAEEKRCTF